MTGYVVSLVIFAIIAVLGVAFVFFGKRTGLRWFGGILAFFFGGFFISASTGGPHWADAPPPTPDPTSEPGTEDNPARGTFEVGGIEYTVTAAVTESTIASVPNPPNGEFLVVALNVKNVGDQPADINATDFHLKRDGKIFDASSDGTYLPDAFMLTKLNPGVEKTGTLLFDVPADTSPSKYELEAFGNGGSDPAYLKL